MRSSRWVLPLAAHLGIAGTAHPQFEALAGSSALEDQIAFAADQGFSGVSDNGLLGRSRDERRRMASALARRELAFGSLTQHRPGERPIAWAAPGVEFAPQLGEALEAALFMRARSVTIVVLDEGLEPAVQWEACLSSLSRAADLASTRGVVLCVEPASRERVPGVLIEHMADALALVSAVGNHALKVVADTCHLALVGDDPAVGIQNAAPQLGGVQVADVPGRVEPGAGDLDFSSITSAIQAARWSGLVEAEFFASREGIDGERAVLAALDIAFGHRFEKENL